MKIGIVGAGFMGRTHAAGWAATDAELTAISSRPSNPPTELAAEYGATAYDSLDGLLESVDVVDVCVPTHLHHDVVAAAANAGKDVICEKPLARTSEQAEAMIAACQQAGVRLLVAHVVRFFPEYAAAKAAVDDNAVGTPAVLRFTRATCEPRWDAWFADALKSGGVVLDLMIHDLDIARWIAGEVKTVFAKGRRARRSSHVEHCLALLTHSDGAITHVEGSWSYPRPMFCTRFEIAGSAGLLDFDLDREAPITLRFVTGDHASEVPLPTSPLAESPFTTQLKHFLAVLRGQARPIVTASDGLEAIRIATAVAESLESGQPATVERTEEIK